MRYALILTIPFATLLPACAQDDPLATEASSVVSQAVAVPDISGVWNYSETTFLVLRPEDDVLHLTCSSPNGELTISQTGSTFTGTLTYETGACEMKGGQPVPTPWALPYHATLSGRITGNALHIDQYDAPPAPPVHCPKSGTISLENGVPVALTTKGRCDLSGVPFKPAIATNEGRAVR
ncbi:MAG TPA: hypothetical protein VK912_08260 [Longimicrobiales bacterium]|nr:hypothetical protein [Longimicrobiales bacterium]